MNIDRPARGAGAPEEVGRGMLPIDSRLVQELKDIAAMFPKEKLIVVVPKIDIGEMHYHYTTAVFVNPKPSSSKLSQSEALEPIRRLLAKSFVESEVILEPLKSIQKLIAEMKKVVNNNQENYDAVQLHFADLKRRVEDLWNFVSKENLYLEEIVDMLEECLRQEKPGGMTKKKLSALSKVVDRMKKIEVRSEDVLECERILDTAGFLTIPQSDYLAGVE